MHDELVTNEILQEVWQERIRRGFHALLNSVGTLAGSETLAGPLAELTARVEKVEAGSRALVNLAALRGLQLILAFFALLFVYRRIESWLGRRAPAR